MAVSAVVERRGSGPTLCTRVVFLRSDSAYLTSFSHLQKHTGGVNRESQLRFGLSPEEVGFLLHQLPDNEVELCRKIGAYTTNTPGQIADDLPDKVMRITPKEGGQFLFLIDFEKDGVGGQSPDLNPPLGPLEVTCQLGEWQVMQQLMQASIPALVGWDAQLKLGQQNMVDAAVQGGPYQGGPATSVY